MNSFEWSVFLPSGGTVALLIQAEDFDLQYHFSILGRAHFSLSTVCFREGEINTPNNKSLI